MRRASYMWLALLSLLASGRAQATPPLEPTTLPNGLKVIVAESTAAPTVAVCLSYAAGTRHEAQGATGLAKLVERLMYQGTRNLGPDDPYLLVSQRGGMTSSTTRADFTQFCSTLPSSQLELAVWLEAERLKNLSATPAAFANQRALLQQEQSTETSSRSHALGARRLSELAYQDYWPYQHGISDADLARLELGDAVEFHWRHYAPNNAVLTIVGAVESAQALALAQRHLSSIAARPLPRAKALPTSPRQSSERLSVVTDPNCSAPGVYYGFRLPPIGSGDHLGLRVIAALLGSGHSARLPHGLISERGRALHTEVWLADNAAADLFAIYVAVAPLATVDKVHEVVEAELKRLRFFGPDAGELDKAKKRLQRESTEQLSTPLERAAALGRAQALGLSDIVPSEAALASITPERIRELAGLYLPDHRRSIVEVYPPGWAQDEPPLVVVLRHTVKRGDNLETIARHYGSSVSEIARASGINSKSNIFPGQVLKVPVAGGKAGGAKKSAIPRTHKVRSGDSLSMLAQAYGTSVSEIVRLNGLDPKKPIVVGQKLTMPPREQDDAASAKSSATPSTKPSETKKPASKKPLKKPPAAPQKSTPQKAAPEKPAPAKTAPRKKP